MTDAASLATPAAALARAWLSPRADRREGLVADPEGLAFLRGLAAALADPGRAESRLAELASDVPQALPWGERRALRRGLKRPDQARSVAEQALRQHAGPLALSGAPDQLGPGLASLRANGDLVTVDPVGDVAPEQLAALAAREDVPSLLVDLTDLAGPARRWDPEHDARHRAARLRPLLEASTASGQPTRIVLDAGLHRDLEATVDGAIAALDSSDQALVAVTVPADAPESLDLWERLLAAAQRRHGAGGAPLTVRLVRGRLAAWERAEAETRGWPVPVLTERAEVDAAFLRLLDRALRPEHPVTVAVASDDLGDLAWATSLADRNGALSSLTLELPHGLDERVVDAVRQSGATVSRRVLLAPPEAFAATLGAVLDRAAEKPAVTEFDLGAVTATSVASPHDQDRREEHPAGDVEGFASTPPTDPGTPGNRAWAADQLDRAVYTTLGQATVDDARVHGPAGLETIIRQTRTAADRWHDRDAALRAWLLHQAGQALARRRGDLVAVMAQEAGVTLADADAEITQAIDAAHYYAESLPRLAAVDGAAFNATRLSVVAPSNALPVASAADSTLAALAAGSAVIVKPAPSTSRCVAVLCEALWQAGVPHDVLRLVSLPEGPLSKHLIAHSDVDQVLVNGAWESAEAFLSWRPGLDLVGHTGGGGTMVVTESADLRLAVEDVVASAFDHAGQHPAAARLVVTVGSDAFVERFERRLADAVVGLRVGAATEPASQIGPLVAPLSDEALALASGESWLVEPRRVGDGTLWSPGVRRGVRPGSSAHRTPSAGPLLGLMRAPDLATAIQWQNATDYALSAGLHSLDADEVAPWVEAAEAGSLFVNRDITGSVVQRQPFGGWKRSSVGATVKSGGPNTLVRLGSWSPRPARHTPDVEASAPVRRLLDAAGSSLSADDRSWLEAAARSDEHAWRREFGLTKDVTRLRAERDLLRYLPVPVLARVEGDPRGALRLLLAAA
ncbi:MAG: proline dehydrogenase family protein, partial [Aeromicrobium sp.]|uniref:proline dehydrogenase family protein n=1 Tax=Aeromicrobium sp. TaxID=1871063 RepID=UPI0039E43172